MPFDHLLLIGFGGPTRAEEVRPFLEEVARGRGIPPERLRQVEHQYEQIGGFSPYNKLSGGLAHAVRERLNESGRPVPVYLGMRQWVPFLSEILQKISEEGLRHGLAFPLAPHRSPASTERYAAALEEGLRGLGETAPAYEFPAPWHDHPLFIEAQAARVRELWPAPRAGDRLVFTAHSIPMEMARACRYEEEFESSCRLTAERLGVAEWEAIYQSRSGDPRQPWLGPDGLSRAPEWKREGVRRVVAVPIGFLFDHTEVLYDLDLLLKNAVAREGLQFLRAPTVMDHPKFVELITQGVLS